MNEHREFVIVRAGPFFVQFAGEYSEIEPEARPIERYIEYGLYGEAVADRFLEPDWHVGEDGALRLESLGWLPPTGERRPNWYREFSLRSDMDLDSVAQLVVETFVEGFRIEEYFAFDMGPRIP